MMKPQMAQMTQMDGIRSRLGENSSVPSVRVFRIFRGPTLSSQRHPGIAHDETTDGADDADGWNQIEAWRKFIGAICPRVPYFSRSNFELAATPMDSS